jgi:replicative DNA helicase
MDREQAKDTVKGYLVDYLESRGISTRRPFCCLNPEHADNNPSMSYDRKRNKVHCFACGADYDLLDLVGFDYGLTDQREIFDKAYSLYGVDVQRGSTATADFKPVGQNQSKSGQYTHTHMDIHTTPAEESKDYLDYFKKCQSNLQQTTYYRQRGISQETATRFMVGYDPSFTAYERDQNGNSIKTTWAALIIPTSRSSYAARNTDPNADKRNRWRKSKGGANLFNIKALEAATKPIYIVEGELDALSIIEVGGEAVGLGSTDNWRKLTKLLESKRPAQPLIIALDNDTEGQKTSGELEAELERMGITFYRIDPYNGSKDANEALMADREAFTSAIESGERIEEEALAAEREKYLQTNTAAHLQAFLNGIAASVDTPFIPTGVSGLDKILDGGLYEGLYVVGAISSLGKTTLVTQIADQIAQAGHDVLIFSLEMARTEIMAKSISRHTLLDVMQNSGNMRDAKTTRGITTGIRYLDYSKEEKALIQRAVTEYGSYAQHIFIHEGIGNIGVEQIRDTVQRHITFTGRTPVVVIDYVQILAPADIRASDKQNTDKAVLELKRISRDYKTPVIGISSLNRASYKEAISMEAFKESGSLEYGSDVLIGLQLKGAGKSGFDANEAKRKNPREIELVILKNRNGSTGNKIELEYYPLFNYFTEPN